MNGLRAPLVGALLCLLAAPPAWGQEGGIVADAPPPPGPATQTLNLSLADAMRMAVAQNPDIRTAELNQILARILEERARLNRFTATFGVASGYEVGFVKVPGEDAYGTAELSYSAGLTGGIPLYTGGRIAAQIRQAEVDAELADVDRVTAERTLERAVYLQYWTIKSFEAQLVASREALDITRESLAVIRARAEAGLAAPIDVNRSEVNVLDQENSILTLEGQMFAAHQELMRLLNVGGVTLVLTDGPTLSPRTWPHDSAALTETAHASRPELVRTSWELERAEAGITLAKSAALPTVTLGATLGAAAAGAAGPEIAYTVTDPSTGEPLTDPSTGEAVTIVQDDGELHGDELKPALGGTLGLNLSWTPFNLLQTRDAVRVARVSQEAVTARQESLRIGIDQEVRSAHNAYEVLVARTPIIDKRLELSRDNLQIIQALYAQGSATILDLFSAQSAYQQATVQRASQEVNLVVAEYELRWALGERFTTE